MKREEDYTEYFVVNKQLEMSPGKIAGQVAHVQTLICEENINTPEYREWLATNQGKIILRGKESQLLKLIEEHGAYFIRDLGRTEIEANSLTCVGFSPKKRKDMHAIVKKFQLLQ